MTDARNKRLAREVIDCQKDTSSGITIRSVGESLDHLIGSFPGPGETSYEGGRFEVDIVVPDRYPFAALKMKFITRVYHPNISSATGFICLDLLGAGWSPVLTIRTALVSLQSLLSSPEVRPLVATPLLHNSNASPSSSLFQPSDPQDAEVAKHYLSDKASFEATAKYWTETYARDPASKIIAAGGVVSEIEMAGLEKSSVEKFTAMGFAQGDVINVLKGLNYRGNNAQNITDDSVVEALCK